MKRQSRRTLCAAGLITQASASKTDMSYGNQLKSVAILEKLTRACFDLGRLSREEPALLFASPV